MTAPPGEDVVPQSGHRVPAQVRSAVKVVLRSYAMATSWGRGMPDYVIIGAKRCGTTSLHRWLLSHPQIVPMFPARQGLKGAHYFDRNYDRSMRWYRSHFPVRRGRHRPLCGEASPYYFIHPFAPERLAAVAPATRLVVLLREPTTRAFSHYRDAVKLGYETLSFGDALAAEPARMAPELARMAADPAYYSPVHEQLSFATQSRYAEHLVRWLRHFPRDQVCVVRSEDLFTAPAPSFRTVTDFLGLDPYAPPTFPRYNASPVGGEEAIALQRLQDELRPDAALLPDLLGLDLRWP